MLGEQLGEEKGKVTGYRVLPAGSQTSGTQTTGSILNPRLEVSFQATGKLFGQNVNDTGTYESYTTDGKTFHGTGQGILMTNDGEVAYWTAQGIGHPTGKGQSINWRGTLFYHTNSQKLSRLNETVVMFEYSVDENGNSNSKIFEWK